MKKEPISRKIGFFSKYLDIIIKLLDFILLRLNFKLLYKLKDELSSFKAKLIFVVMTKDWVVYWIGKYITENLNKFGLIDSLATSPKKFRNKIIHWGSINDFIHNREYSKVDKNATIKKRTKAPCLLKKLENGLNIRFDSKNKTIVHKPATK